jgi:ankyrin repeat protein
MHDAFCPIWLFNFICFVWHESEANVEKHRQRQIINCVKFLAEHTPEGINAETDTHLTPLLIAVKSGLADVCEALIADGAKVNVADSNGETGIHWAAYHSESQTY